MTSTCVNRLQASDWFAAALSCPVSLARASLASNSYQMLKFERVLFSIFRRLVVTIYLTDNGARNPAGKLPFSGGTWRKHGRWDLTIAFRDLGAEGSP